MAIKIISKIATVKKVHAIMRGLGYGKSGNGGLVKKYASYISADGNTMTLALEHYKYYAKEKKEAKVDEVVKKLESGGIVISEKSFQHYIYIALNNERTAGTAETVLSCNELSHEDGGQ